MSNSGSSSTRSYSVRGIPRKCRYGKPTTILVAKTKTNPDRKFYRCVDGYDGNDGHVFKWVNEAKFEEFDILSEKQQNLSDDFAELLQSSQQLMVKLEKVVQKTKKLENEVKSVKATLRNTIVSVVIAGFVVMWYRM